MATLISVYLYGEPLILDSGRISISNHLLLLDFATVSGYGSPIILFAQLSVPLRSDVDISIKVLPAWVMNSQCCDFTRFSSIKDSECLMDDNLLLNNTKILTFFAGWDAVL